MSLQEIGVCLLPEPKQIQALYNLAERVSKSYDLKFLIGPDKGLPHVTLFMGEYEEPRVVIEQVERIEVGKLSSKPSSLAIWLQEYVFLDIGRTELLNSLHLQVFDSLRHLCNISQSPDTTLLTPGETESLRKTGYPFSLDQFRPHFTLGLLDQRIVRPLDADLSAFLATNLDESLNEITFNRICIDRVQQYGACKDILFEKILS